MDRLLLVPENEDNHDVLPVINEIFQNTFCTNRFPYNIAENVTKYRIDEEHKEMEIIALNVMKTYQEAETSQQDISTVETEIMQIHAMAMIEKNNDLPYEEMLRLKRHEVFQNLSDHAVATYNLLQRADLYPNKIEQYLDFTYNPSLHTCKRPCPQTKIKKIGKPLKRPICPPDYVVETVSTVFTTEPGEIVFYNYELNHTYKKKFKLRNTTQTLQNFYYFDFPKSCPFRLQMLSESCQLAPGMCAEFVVTFKPEVYKNYREFVKFRTRTGDNVGVPVSGSRDSPKLICYVFNPSIPLEMIKQPGPGSKYFSDRRRSALNFTIDCGTCLLGNYSVVTLIMKNVGQRGRFLVTSEDEWFFTELQESTCRSVELAQGCFSIFPVFFEIDHNEVGELFVMFLPKKIGVFTEKIIIINDNNSHQEIELLGDCICFSNTFLKVNMYLLPDTFNYSDRMVTITLHPNERSAFIFSVINNRCNYVKGDQQLQAARKFLSQINNYYSDRNQETMCFKHLTFGIRYYTLPDDADVYFEYYWALKTATEEADDKKKMDKDWIRILNTTKCLPSFSTTDVIVELVPKTTEEGAYYTFISLYIKNLPITCVPECQYFIITNENEEEEDRYCTISCAPSTSKDDITNEKIFDSVYKNEIRVTKFPTAVVVALVASKSKRWRITISSRLDLLLKEDKTVKPVKPKLRFSKTFINFGIIAKGVEIWKTLTVESLTKKEIQWKVVEVRYKDDEMIAIPRETSSLNRTGGTLKKKHQKRKLTYTVQAKERTRWVSFLALFSLSSCSCSLTLESICMVTYEIAEINIIIRTDNLLPVLCPKQFLYLGIPTIHTIHVHNCGILTGCFYFLKPVGDEANKIRVKFFPQSGIVGPGACVEVKVELVALEHGIFDDLYVPCFIGDPERLISLRILCTVASISVFFYLPYLQRGYHKILWPPKSDSNVDWEYFADHGEGEGSVQDAEDRTIAAVNWKPAELDEDLRSLIADDSVAATYPTTKTGRVQTKHPTKLTFYIENLSPIDGNFAVLCTNFGPEQRCIDHILVKAGTKTAEYLWEKACQDGYGIVIEPERPSGNMVPHEVVEIDLWIYANTWGKYLEEIIVEVNDLTPFCFNLIVEVVGLPLEFPFARNTTLDLPTIRLECIAYSSEENTRTGFSVVNGSSIPVEVSWHVFKSGPDDEKTPFNLIAEIFEDTVDLQLSRECYGSEACCDYIEVEPLEYNLPKQANTMMTVFVKSDNFEPKHDKTHLKYNLIGFINLRDEYKFKENYFRRVSGMDLDPAKVIVVVALEMPIMELDLASDETTIDIFVNDILFNRVKDPEIYLLLRNIDMSTVVFSINIARPFVITKMRTIPPRKTKSDIKLKRNECLQVLLHCHFTCEDLIQFAEFIYKDIDGSTREKVTEFTSIIRKNLCVIQKGAPRQMIPFEVRLHYPEIEVRPSFIKFGPCLLFCTKKMILSIYNLTAAPVKFEIYKTSNRDDFELNPNHGEVQGSTGVNKQFLDVFVYFTPRDCKLYIENLRIISNIPQYFIDVPVTGYGSNNEKFYVP